MNKNIIIGIVVVIVVAGGIFLVVQSQNNSSITPPVTTAPTTTTLPPAPVAVPVPTSPTTPVTPTQTTPTPVSVIHSVTIQNFAFSPASLTVKMGDTVVWTNKDSVAHNVVGTNGGPSSAAIPMNGTYSYTFMSPGTFAYRCTFHPAMPPGSVVVTQ